MFKFIVMRKSLVLLLVIILVASCGQKTAIPEKDMVSILAKIQILDASIQHHKYRNKFFEKDTIDYYSKTIESFGYTKAQFDSSLSFYTRNPKILDAIYDKVIIELSKVETKISALSKERLDSLERDTVMNYWNLKKRIEFPKDEDLGTVDFSIPVKGLGVYTVYAEVCIFEDDRTLNPEMEAFFFFDDKSKNGNKSSFTSSRYSKGNDTLVYSVQLELKNSLVTHLKGSLFAHSNSGQKIARHAVFTNIKVNFKQNISPKQRIRNKLRKNEQIESSR